MLRRYCLFSLLALSFSSNVLGIDHEASRTFINQIKKNTWSYSTLQTLLDQGADINRKTGESSTLEPQYSCVTSLHIAAMRGDIKLAKFLIKNGADLNSQQLFTNQTPLFVATEHGHWYIAKLLLDNGAAVDDNTDCHGWTPLMCAAQQGYTTIVQLLLKHGASFTQCYTQHFSDDFSNRITPKANALTLAAENGQIAVVKAILAYAASKGNLDPINSCDGEGYTALHRAAMALQREMVKFLIDNNANPAIKTNAGQTVFDLMHDVERKLQATEDKIACQEIAQWCRIQAFEMHLLPIATAYVHLYNTQQISGKRLPPHLPRDIIFRMIAPELVGNTAAPLNPTRKPRDYPSSIEKKYPHLKPWYRKTPAKFFATLMGAAAAYLAYYWYTNIPGNLSHEELYAAFVNACAEKNLERAYHLIQKNPSALQQFSATEKANTQALLLQAANDSIDELWDLAISELLTNLYPQ